MRYLRRPQELSTGCHKHLIACAYQHCIVICKGRFAALYAARDGWQWLLRILKAPAAGRGHLGFSGGVALPGRLATMLHTPTASQATTMCCRKAAAAYVANAAASHSAKGGSTLHHCPEMMLQFVVQHLAHHPDFPIMQVS